MPADRAARGAAAEDAALRFLQQHGLRLIERNFRTRHGELDLVMDHAGTLAVVEVRARARADFGGAAASVVAAKQRRIVNATRFFLRQHLSFSQRPVRFDIVALDGDREPQWLQGAFDATE